MFARSLCIRHYIFTREYQLHPKSAYGLVLLHPASNITDAASKNCLKKVLGVASMWIKLPKS